MSKCKGKNNMKKSVFTNQKLFTNGEKCGIIKEVAEGRNILVDRVRSRIDPWSFNNFST